MRENPRPCNSLTIGHKLNYRRALESTSGALVITVIDSLLLLWLQKKCQPTEARQMVPVQQRAGTAAGEVRETHG